VKKLPLPWCVVVLASLVACGGPGATSPGPSRDPRAVVWRYEVRGNQDELKVEASFAPGGFDQLRVDDDATRFVQDVTYASGQGWVGVQPQAGAWTVPCHAAGCRVRYRFPLRQAAVTLDDSQTAVASGDVVVAPPSTWLLHPGDTVGRVRFHVSLTPPARFAAGTHPSRDGSPDTFEASVDDFDDASFAVVGPFLEGVVRSGTARVDVAISPHGLALRDKDVVAWVQTAVDALARYFGGFPVDRTLVVVQAGRPGSPTRGETLGATGPAVLVRPGDGVTAATTRDDWVVTHELVHVVMPTLSREHIWLSEGIATYVEPVARVRAGTITPEKFWGDLVEGLPQGLPETGDEGLEKTHTWGRTYWGGSLYCLMADVTIRERTANAHSFDDALRAVVATGDHVEEHWGVERFLDVGDRATGTTILHDLYRTLALAPTTVDLPALWSRLGVRASTGTVVFDDAAPLASVRRGIEGR
jgi:predicted metalloprotease with PDZ domain